MSLQAQAAAAELAQIRKNLGVAPAAFEPGRRTMIIEGRPLQVLCSAMCMYHFAQALHKRLHICAIMDSTPQRCCSSIHLCAGRSQ